MIELDEKSKEALTSGLKQAKSKRMFFALVVKGTDGVLIVSKLKIPPKQIADAKKTCGGNTVVRGACFGEKEKLIFEVAKPPAPTWDKIVKTIARRDANLTISPLFRLGDSDDLKEEDESEEQDQATSGTSNEPEVTEIEPEAPESSVVPPAPQHDPALAQIIAAMGKLMPALQAAIKASPQQKDELIKLAGEVQSRIKSGDAASAKESLLNLGKRVKELKESTAQSSTPTETEPQTSANPLAGQWEKTLQDLEPRYLEGLKLATSDQAGKMRAIFTYATEQAEAGQFEKALAALQRLEPMVAQAMESTSPGATREVEAGIVEKRKFLVTRFREILDQLATDTQKIRKAVEEKVPDEDANELGDLIEDALGDFVSLIQDEIDSAINAGSSSVLRGLKKRVTSNELVQKLVNNDLGVTIDLQDKLLAALEEIEDKMAA